jgi:hypothetical protein
MSDLRSRLRLSRTPAPGQLSLPLLGGKRQAGAPRRKIWPRPVVRYGDVERERSLVDYVWRLRQPIAGTPAERYLRETCGYGGPIPATIGFLPARGEHPPALIAAFGMASELEPGELAIIDDDVRAVHLIKLTPDGSGRANLVPNPINIGRGAQGFPIVVAAANDLLGLAITEDVEDALAVHEATGLGAWASGRATRLSPLADCVPDYIDFVTVFAERDSDGFRFAHALADKLGERGIGHAVSLLDEGGRP